MYSTLVQMAACSAPMAAAILLLFLLPDAASALRLLTVDPGQNATLKCDTGNAFITVVEWTRDDLQSEYVLLVVDGHSDPTKQDPSFKDRAMLVDNKMRNKNASLVLKHVKSADSGIYRCRVEPGGSSRKKRAVLGGEPVESIELQVTGPQSGKPTRDHSEPMDGNFPRGYAGLGASFALCCVMVGSFLGWKYSSGLDRGAERCAAVEAAVTQLI